MIVLSTYLRLKGLVTIEEVIDRCGEESIEELDELIENKFVSVHTEPMGGKKYRFPYYSSWKIEGEKKPDMKVDSILGIIEENPGVNATTIRKKLVIAQRTFEKREQELLDSGKITRLKKGVSWCYYLHGEDLPEADDVEDRETVSLAYSLFLDYLDGFVVSMQQMAKERECSREHVTKLRDWLIAQGILVDGKVVWPDTLEERKVWLTKHFGSVLDEKGVNYQASKGLKSAEQPKPVVEQLPLPTWTPEELTDLDREILKHVREVEDTRESIIKASGHTLKEVAKALRSLVGVGYVVKIDVEDGDNLYRRVK